MGIVVSTDSVNDPIVVIDIDHPDIDADGMAEISLKEHLFYSAIVAGACFALLAALWLVWKIMGV